MAATPTIQRGTITLADTTSSVTVDRGVDPGFDTAVDPTKCILDFSQRTAGTSATPLPDYGVTGTLTDGNTITFERQGTAGDVVILWTLVAFDTGVVTQYESVTLTGTASGTSAISAASLGGGRWIIPLGVRGTAGTPQRNACQWKFDSTTQISATRNIALANVVANCVVVEHDSATVQTLDFTLTTTTNTTEDQTVTAVTVANTAVWASQATTATGDARESAWTMALTSTTNLRFTRNTGTSATFTITAFVVSFDDGTTVASYAPLHSTGVGTVNTTITAVTLARAYPVATNTWIRSFGVANTATFGRNLFTAELTSTTNLQTIKGISTTDATPTIQVVEWAVGGGTAALTGTLLTAPIVRGDIQAGGKTIIVTLTGDTWVASGATFDAQRQNIIDGLDAASSPANGWNDEVRDVMAVTTVVRTSDTIVTITLPATPAYGPSAAETITVTIPATAVTLAAPIVATPTISILVGPLLDPTSGTTNGSGVLATALTSDDALTANGEVLLITATYNATVVGRVTGRPS